MTDVFMPYLLNLDTTVTNTKHAVTTQNNTANKDTTIYKGKQIDGNLHEINVDYNNGFQWMGGLQNLDTTVTNTKHAVTTQNNTVNKDTTIYKGKQIDGNLHEINVDYNNGFQWMGGLQNLDKIGVQQNC